MAAILLRNDTYGASLPNMAKKSANSIERRV